MAKLYLHSLQNNYNDNFDLNLIFIDRQVITPADTLIAKFTLPTSFTNGEGILTCTVTDGGVVEAFSKTIPIIRNDIMVRSLARTTVLIPNFKFSD